MAKERKRSFLLYETQRGLVNLLGEGERAALLTAIYDYVATGEHAPLPSVAADVAFAAIKGQLDIDAERYDEICEVRRAAANARWEKEQKDKKEEKPLPEPPKKQEGKKRSEKKAKGKSGSGCKCTYNDTDTDTDNDTDNDNDNDNERRASGRGSFETDAFFAAAVRRSYEGRDGPNEKGTPQKKAR